jgi:triosephosphate isomerase
MTKSKLIVANWKMNPETEAEAKDILNKIKAGMKKAEGNKIIICPPFVFINLAKKILLGEDGISLGAQDVFVGQGNSHTGEIGMDMLKELSVKYVIVGHSEKKASGETDEMINKKLIGLIKNNFKVILCVGEKERNEHGDYYHEIKRQLHSGLDSVQKKFAKNIVVAYEPVWAIGKSEGGALDPEKLREMNIFIKKILSDIFKHEEAEKIPVLYGGSVGVSNAKEIIEKGNVDGLLIGRDSVEPKNFLEIVKEVK